MILWDRGRYLKHSKSKNKTIQVSDRERTLNLGDATRKMILCDTKFGADISMQEKSKKKTIEQYVYVL